MVGGKSSRHLGTNFPQSRALRYTTGFYRLIPLQSKYFQNDPCESFRLSLGNSHMKLMGMLVGKFKLNR